ncbi:HNH endonuclease [Arthrobacter sp. OVS8]|nr:HNH endonuclease [Arthrobacter sp. OVS8]
MEAGFRRRCSRPAEHGDHFYPWSKGGSASFQNFVAACSRCNRTKGARIPWLGLQLRMERRRWEYFAPDGSVAVGERQPLRKVGCRMASRTPTSAGAFRASRRTALRWWPRAVQAELLEYVVTEIQQSHRVSRICCSYERNIGKGCPHSVGLA